MDDGYIIGPSDVIFPALVTSERRLQEECRLVLQRDKAGVLSWDGVLRMEAPAGMVLARLEMEGERGALTCFLCYGLPVRDISSHRIQGVPSAIGSSSRSAPPSIGF